MYFFNELTRKAAEKFRTALYVAAANSGKTQTEISAAAGIEQCSFSQYLSQNSDKNSPAFLIPLLPPQISTDLLRYLGDQMNHVVLTKKEHLKLSGNIDAEVLEIVRLEGEFIALRKKDSVKARKKIDELREMVDKLDEEMKLIEKK